jgi:hypothetical protein
VSSIIEYVLAVVQNNVVKSGIQPYLVLRRDVRAWSGRGGHAPRADGGVQDQRRDVERHNTLKAANFVKPVFLAL